MYKKGGRGIWIEREIDGDIEIARDRDRYA